MHKAAAVLLLCAALAGCFTGREDPAGSGGGPLPWPHPSGSEWPLGLEGPFALRNVDHIQVLSHDGVALDGYVAFPDLPPGVRAPVVLVSTPYLSSCYVRTTGSLACQRNPASDAEGAPTMEDAWWEDGLQRDKAHNGVGVLPIRWIEQGFVLANFQVRGTGESGGCFEAGGWNEQRDQDVLITWLASQPWSNGRVGMGGLSYNGWTTMQAAVQGNPALAAVISMAPVVDFYEFEFTPQGARIYASTHVMPTSFQQFDSGPPLFTDPGAIAPAVAEGARCPTPAPEAREQAEWYSLGTRDRAYLEERDLSERLSHVRAAVLQVQGFPDPGHFFQDRNLTQALDDEVPVREIRGWWGHVYPPPNIDPPGDDANWEDTALAWFSYWLKGVGPMPRLGVDHLDQRGTWHESSDWPPSDAEETRFFLSSGKVQPTAGGEGASFRSAPPPEFGYGSFAAGVTPSGEPSHLGGASVCAGPAASAVYQLRTSDPVVISGNPVAHLRISSDLPGGLVAVTLFDLAPEFRCDEGVPTGATWLASGAADLEYFETRYEPRPFPVATPAEVPVFLTDVTAAIEPGHSLAVVLSHGEFGQYLASAARYPQITVHAGPGLDATSIDLPLLAGAFNASVSP